MTTPNAFNNDELTRFISEDLGGFLSETKAMTSIPDNTTPLISNNNDITNTMAQFLEKGASVLDTMSVYCNTMPDAECVASMASLLNALTSTIDSISKMYKDEQAHLNKLELEEIKHKNKLKEFEFKEQLKHNKPGEDVVGDNVQSMVEFSTADIIQQIIDSQK